MAIIRANKERALRDNKEFGYLRVPSDNQVNALPTSEEVEVAHQTVDSQIVDPSKEVKVDSQTVESSEEVKVDSQTVDSQIVDPQIVESSKEVKVDHQTVDPQIVDPSKEVKVDSQIVTTSKEASETSVNELESLEIKPGYSGGLGMIRGTKPVRKGADDYEKVDASNDIKPIYPIIEQNVPQLLPDLGNYTLSNNTESWVAPITAGALAIASIISAKPYLTNYMTKQLGLKMSYKNLALKIVSDHGFSILTMNRDKLITIKDVADTRAKQIIDCSKSFIKQSAIAAKATDGVVDLAEAIYEPNVENFKALLADLTDLHMIYYGANPYNVLIASGSAAYSAYQGEYKQAGEETLTILTALLLTRMMGTADVSYPGTSLGLLSSLGLIAMYGDNLYTRVMEYMSDVGHLKSRTAYKDVFKFLSNSPVKYLYDFSSLAIKYEIDVNNFKLSKELEHAKLRLDSREEFGQKLYEHIFAPVIQAQYDLLNKVAKGELTQEVADILMPKHLVIALEGRAYDHCVTKDSDNVYYCYNDNLKVIDKVVIGENTIDVDSLYYS